MAEYLNRCITSVINQTHKSLEIIIVDDGSTDDSVEVIERFRQSDPRIKLICQENQGHSAARNVGIENAESDYLFFIDSDDYIRPETIELLLSNLIQNGGDISFGGSIRNGEFPEVNNSCRVLNSREALEILTKYDDGMNVPLKFYLNPTWNRIFKKSLFSDIKFPEGHVRDDNFTVHRLLDKANKIVWVKTITYFYYLKPNTMSEEGLFKNKDLILAHEDRIRYLTERGYTELLPDVYSYYLYICYQTFREIGDYSIIENAQEFINSNRETILKNSLGERNIKNIEEANDIIIYTYSLSTFCGLYIWTLNFCRTFKHRHIKILSREFRPSMKKALSQYAECEYFSSLKNYTCRVLIQNFQVDRMPVCFKADKVYVALHCDYTTLHTTKFQKNVNYIAVSERARDTFIKRFKLPCRAIKPIMLETNIKKVYKFISATRLTKEKGTNRMLKFAELLKQSGVCWQWLVFCEKDMVSITFRSDYPELIIANLQSNETMLNYMADADYVVQLSDSEGFCYSVHESLSVGTPVIVTDLPVFDFIQDGYNGYKVPLDMTGIDINQIVSNIPKDFRYDSDNQASIEKWEKLL